MEYLSTRRMESKSCPGVAFAIRKMTVGRRAALEELQREMRGRLQALQAEMAPLSKEYRAAVEAAKAAVRPERDKLVTGGMARQEAEREIPLGPVDFDEEKLKRLMEFSERMGKVDREELTPSAIEFALVGIENLTIDGEPATLPKLRECGPDELYEEIAQAVAREMGLLPEERENLVSPSTSAAAVDGSEKPGSAATVEKLVMITSAGAPSITDRGSVIAASTA
jgi:hypothetical protein